MMLRRQDNRVNSIIFTRKLVIFVFVVLSAPAVYLIIGNDLVIIKMSQLPINVLVQDHQISISTWITLLLRESSDNFISDLPRSNVRNETTVISDSPADGTSFEAESSWDTSFTHLMSSPENGFSITGNDVLVFVHIQKTAGTSFEKFLVRHLKTEHPCQCIKGKKRCTCSRPDRPDEFDVRGRSSLHCIVVAVPIGSKPLTFLWYRYGCSLGTQPVGCAGAKRVRRYFYTTFLREPVARFISEYRHVNRGATWIASRHICNGRAPTSDELPLCFDPHLGWDDVSLDEFLHCPFNLAFNR
ncbi:unnamed protein product [Cylicostephanus goldi]|uniref:Heparan-sulfate 6-O-sulfotransferase n=1 Tax=Cylicostephanus goldi TaxID=71465 RepID=A0A3P6RVF1_CYLGO|nr:unnamed protein product [Cylicostephanus goldi]